jgi:anti-sigma regulatory factor (Ser/Thr protein kinase)
VPRPRPLTLPLAVSGYLSLDGRHDETVLEAVGFGVDTRHKHGDTGGGPLSAVWALRPCPAAGRAGEELVGWSVGLDPDPAAPGCARRALEPLSAHLGRQGMEDARLLVTELVTNSVLHGEGGPGSILVKAHLFFDQVVICVSDEGIGFEPAELRGSRPGVPGGRGLELVALLADHRGIDRRSPFRVWFALCR